MQNLCLKHPQQISFIFNNFNFLIAYLFIVIHYKEIIKYPQVLS